MKILLSFLAGGLLISSCVRDDDPGVPKPVADFDITAAKTDYPTQANNRSTNATDYLWTWGDGTASTEQAPNHIFERTGDYRVKLQASGIGGTDTLSKIVRISYGGVPPGLLNKLAGQYTGQLRYTSFNAMPPGIEWRRDTTLTISVVSPTAVSLLGYRVEYQSSNASGNPARWRGHAPLRSSYNFENGSVPSTNFGVLQTERRGDSIFFDSRRGGFAFYTTFTFYGKKRP